MTNWRKCPVRDNISVEKTNPATTRCPVRDNIWVEHVAYLTARPCSRRYSISTNISSLTGCRAFERHCGLDPQSPDKEHRILTGCCSVKNVNEYFILAASLNK